jgi:hypothetical protein
VSWRPVTVRRLDDDSARVAGQLRQGERIVALGAHLLREGEQVRVAVQPPAVASVAGGAVNAVSAAKVANAATPGARP